MRFWFVELPARLFDLWWAVYTALLTILIMASVTVTIIALVLEFGFGIRWGW